MNGTNLDSLWAWTGAEKPAGQPFQWANPLNTTQEASGATNQNSVGVKAFPSTETAISATVTTLLNGHYPNIVANLRSATPRGGWTNACSNLHTWGTGCSWLGRTFSVPSGGSGADNPLAKMGLAAQGQAERMFGNPLATITPQSVPETLNPFGELNKSLNTISEKAFYGAQVFAGMFIMGIGLFLVGIIVLAEHAGPEIEGGVGGAMVGGPVGAVAGAAAGTASRSGGGRAALRSVRKGRSARDNG